MKMSHPALFFKVTPADYQPPGFKEGECDSLWFEGLAGHFRVGEVQTAFHTFRVRVSAEQSRLEKLKEANHPREDKHVSQENPPEIKVGPERSAEFQFYICPNTESYNLRWVVAVSSFNCFYH